MTDAPPALRFISEADTQRLLTWPAVIACLARAYGARHESQSFPPRAVARGNRVWLRALAAAPADSRHMGAKLIARSRGLGVSYLLPLWEQDTGDLVALIDAKHITALRTAGTSAVAVDRLAPRRPLTVAVLGSGGEARAHVEALAAVRSIAELRIFSPTAANRERFAQWCAAALGLRATAAASPATAVAAADLVVAAARSHDETPILQGEWLQPGATVVSIGSTLPEQRKVDPETVRRSTLIVADVPGEVSDETGDMIAAREAGVALDDKLVALADLVQGRCAGRTGEADVVMFKSVGSALQDLAVAELCLELALEQGAGTQLPVGLTVKNR